jgi:hypothetical protein
MWSRIDPFLDQLPPPHERQPGQRNNSFFSIQTRPLELGGWYHGIRALVASKT